MSWSADPRGCSGLRAPELKTLTVRETRCGDAGRAARAGALATGAPKLEELDVHNNEAIGPDGLRALARAPLLALEKLELSGIEMGDAGVCALADELREGAWPSLEQLRLMLTGAGDDGLKALGRALGRGAMPKLKEIVYNQDGGKFAEGKRAVAAARPGVEVDT